MTTALRKKNAKNGQLNSQMNFIIWVRWTDMIASHPKSHPHSTNVMHVGMCMMKIANKIQRVYVLRIEFISHQPPQHARQTSITYTTQKYLLFILVAFNRCSCHAIASKRILFYFRCKFIGVLCDFFCISFVIGWWTAQNRTGQRR